MPPLGSLSAASIQPPVSKSTENESCVSIECNKIR